MDTEVYNDVAKKSQDHPYVNKTGVKSIEQERSYKTIKYVNSSSDITDTPATLPRGNDYVHPYSYATLRSSKGEEYMQPYSHIQQPYLDLSDISVVRRISMPAERKNGMEDKRRLKRRMRNRRRKVCCWALLVTVCLSIIELAAIICILMKKEVIQLDNEFGRDSSGLCGNTTGNKWHLGMNLNPSDGHIMDYTTGWNDGYDIGNADTAFNKDYLSKNVWAMPVNFIGIVRHQNGFIEAVKVWEFKKKGRSMLTRFKAMIPGREIATIGGPKQVYIISNITNNIDDPIFSIPGDIAINWWYVNNGCRMALTGGHLSPEDSDDDNTHGLGNHFFIDVRTGADWNFHYKHEISNIQNCTNKSCPKTAMKLQGTDHGLVFRNGPVYGNYAIFVSKNAQRFPICREKLMLQMNE